MTIWSDGMSYGYWSTIIAVLLLLLLLLRVIPGISHRVLLIAANFALLRALLPITVPSMTSIYNWLNPRLHIEETPVIHATYAAGDVSVSNLSLTIQNSTNVFHILTGIGIAFFAILSLWAAINSYRLIKNSYVCADAATMSWVESNKKKFYKLTVLHSVRISTPISCDFVLRSFILVPPVYELRDDNIGVYTHELMHIRHRDTIWKILALLVLCVHWFNPIVWMLIYIHRIETELACDEEVLQVFGADYRSQYARDLIDYSSGANYGFAFTSSIVFTPFQ